MVKKNTVKDIAEEYFEDASGKEGKSTIKSLMKSFLENQDYTQADIKKIIKNFDKGIKESEEETELSHGTSCPGLVTKDHTRRPVEF